MTAATTNWTEPGAGVDVAAQVMAAAAREWPTLGVEDLATIHTWANDRAHLGAGALVDHLTTPGHSDPRIQVTLRLAATVPTEETVSKPRPVAAAAITCQVPHDLISDAELPDAALQVWLLMGTLPPLNREHRPVMAWWLAERGGAQWAGLSEPTVKKRIRRAAADLAAVGALSVQTEHLGRGRTRSLYRRHRLPEKHRFEVVPLRVVQALTPQLLRAYLRWLQVMGHRRCTRQSLSALAQRWGMSRMNARRQRDALVEANLLEVTDGVVRVAGQESAGPDADSASDPSYPQATDGPPGGGTFSSGGRHTLVRPYKEEKNRRELHPSGTLVPRTQVGGRDPEAADLPTDHQPDSAEGSPRAAAPPTEQRSPESGKRAAAAVSAKRSRSELATTTHWGQAGRIVACIRWLAVAPARVRGQARTVLAGLLKDLPDAITPADVHRAIATIDPGEPTTEHVRLIRTAVSGLHADLKAKIPTAPPRPGPVPSADRRGSQPMPGFGRRQRQDPRCPVEQFRPEDPLEVFRRPPQDIDWTDPNLADEDVFEWLCVLYVRHLDTHGPAVIATIRNTVQRRIPTRWRDTATAAADTVAALASPRAAAG